MLLSYLGISDPINDVNNMIMNRLSSYRKNNPGLTPPLEISGVYGADLVSSANFAANHEIAVFTSAGDLFSKSDMIFAFLPDKSLKNLAKDLKGHNIRNKIICHFSPAFDADVLDFGSDNTYMSFYIPISSDVHESNRAFEIVFVEGYGPRFVEACCMMDIISVKYVQMDKADKLLFLAATGFLNELRQNVETAAYRLMKIALHGNSQLCETFVDAHKSGELNFESYDAVTKRDISFIQKQADAFKNVGIEKYSSLYAALMLSQIRSTDNDASLNARIERMFKKILTTNH